MILKYLKLYLKLINIVMSDEKMNRSRIYYDDLKRIQESIPNIEKLFSKSLLITGASGLIGSALVEFVCVLNDTANANIKMILTSRNLQHLKNRFGEILDRKDISIVEHNLMTKICLPYSPDYIIHAAAPANPRWYSEKPAETINSIYNGTYYILEYAKENKTDRVLFVSSSEVYGKIDISSPYTENNYGFVDILDSRSCYPSAKRLSETMCASYFQEYNVDFVIVRPGHVYGPSFTAEDSRASSFFLRSVRERKNIVMKSLGDQKRSYCYICDCVSAIITVLINGKTAEAYNISNPNSICTIRDIAERIAMCGGVHVVFDIPTEEEKRGYNRMENSTLDSSMLESLGWKGLFDLYTGVDHTVKYLMMNMENK